MEKRVAITGMGTICGLGHNLQECWKNLVEGKSGISKLESFDVSTLSIQIAGEVKNFSLPEHLLSAKEAQRYDRFLHLALMAGDEALAMAGLVDLKNFHGETSIGTILGVGMGGFPMIETTHSTFLEKGARRISPFFIPGIIPNMASGIIALKFGLKGVSYSISSACASSSHAIATAYNEIQSGRQSAMITGGSEAVLGNLCVGGFASMKALSKQENPIIASRPFDKDRDGFVVGEGGAVLVLEDLEKAKERGAIILGEIVGHGTSCDAYHITAPHPDGEGAARCMELAVQSAKIHPDQISYINAHGTSTPLGDIGETKAIKKVFGDHAYKKNISSTKSMTGHLLGAAGGIEAIFSMMALREGIIPPTINLDNPDPECDLDYTPLKAKRVECEYALSNSFGFGGTNASLILKKYTGD